MNNITLNDIKKNYHIKTNDRCEAIDLYDKRGNNTVHRT